MRSLAILSLAVASAVSMADVVHLRDGRRVEGRLQRTEAGWRVTGPDGVGVEVSARDVVRIEAGGAAGNDALNLASLRRAVENLDGIADVLARYERFLAGVQDAGVAAQARQDVELWRQRQADGLVRFAGGWVTPQARDLARDEAVRLARQASTSLAQGQSLEAGRLVDEALRLDPQCVAALYLAGVRAWEDGDIAAARRSFDGVNAVIADHAPTLNNLAAVLVRQRAPAPAAAMLDQALAAAPLDRALLDNAAELLNLLGNAASTGAPARLQRRFGEQDARLQEALARQGLYRWGGGWIDRARHEQLQKELRDARDAVAAVRQQFDAARVRFEQIRVEIDANERTLRQIENDSYFRDAEGRFYRLPYPATYFDLQAQNRRLEQERAELGVRLESLRAQHAEAEKRAPTPPFSGALRIIGVEGTPLPPAPSATRPAPR